MKSCSVTICMSVLMAFLMGACSDDVQSGSTGENTTEVRHVPRRSAKRGVGYSFQLPQTDMLLLSSGISWFYNWGTSCSDDITSEAERYSIGFVPMAWNNHYDTVAIAKSSAIFGGEYLLAFNEPNLTNEANMTPTQAAAYWPALKSFAKSHNLKIISPALNYGTLPGYSDPTVWLDEFLSQDGVSAEDIHAIALHCYMSSASSLKGFIDKFRKYGKPVWLTEFCAWDESITSAESQIAYMSEAVSYLEENDLVERYAWFIPRHNGYPYMALLEDEALTDAGHVYVGASSADKGAFALPSQVWPASQYQASNVSECMDADAEFKPAPRLRIAQDAKAQTDLEVTNFSTGKWLQYGVDATTEVSSLTLRLNTKVSSDVAISVDGSELVNTQLSTSGEWQEVTVPIDVPRGTHEVRISVVKGSLSLGWLRFGN